jgi:hypothetical protein
MHFNQIAFNNLIDVYALALHYWCPRKEATTLLLFALPTVKTQSKFYTPTLHPTAGTNQRPTPNVNSDDDE